MPNAREELLAQALAQLSELRAGGLSINGQAANRVPYASSETQLATSANLTFDGSNLFAGGNITTFGNVVAAGTLRVDNNVTLGDAISAVHAINGQLTLGGPLYIASGAIIRPTTLSADVNNWAPTGFSDALLVIAEVNASVPGNKNITGLAAGAQGRVVFLVNRRGGGDTLTLVANSGSSSAGNRFGGSIVMESGCIAMLIWDADGSAQTADYRAGARSSARRAGRGR